MIQGEQRLANLATVRRGWHHSQMPLPPWVIQEIEEERSEREEDARVRSSRIELPQQPHEEALPAAREPVRGGVTIFQISPQDDSVLDI